MAKQLNVNLAFTADTSKAKAQLQDLQNQLSQVINMPTAGLGEKMTTEINQAAHAAAELKVHLQNATNVKTGNLDFTKLNQSIKNSGSSLTEYAKKIQSIGPEGQKAFMLLAQSVASAEVPIRRSNALLTELWTTMKNTARWQLTSSMLHGFMGAVQSAVGYAEDLNESLNNIRIVTGNSVDQMAEFAKEANKAAKSLSTSTTNYTNAALIYYQQGLDEQQVLERADITTKMANVSRQSAEEVSDQLTAIWNNFYDGSQSLEHYADAMTRLGADTASSSDEIAQGLEKFAAIGDMIGLSFDNAAAALATVTATTRQSADVVGTAFKTIFARIQGLSLGETLEDGTNLNKYSEALNKVGISIFEQNGELKDMDNILDEMGAKWKTMSKDQQVALAQTVAGVRQYNQLVALMDNYDFYEQNLFSAQTADGSLQEQADIYAESWEAASKRVDAALEGLYDSLINDEAFIDLLNGIEKIVSATEMMVDSMGGFGGVISGLGVIFTNVFRKQITQSITDASYSLMSWTESGRQKIQKEKLDQFSQMLQKAEIGETERAILQAQFESYQQLTEKAKDLTDLERETYQILLDQQKARGKLAIQKEQEFKKAESQEKDMRADLKYAVGAYGKNNRGKKKAFDQYEKDLEEVRKKQKAFDMAAEGADKDKAFTELATAKQALEKSRDHKYLKEYKKDFEEYEKVVIKTVRAKEEFDDALKEATKTEEISSQKTKDNSKVIQENTNKNKENAKETKKTGDAKEELAKDTEKSSNALEKENKELEKNKLNSSDIARNFVAGAGAAMSAASAIQAFSSAIDTLNSDAEPLEKLPSLFMSLSMGGSMAMNSLNSLNKITLTGGKSLGQAAANTKLATAVLGKFGVVTETAGAAATSTGASIAALGGYALIAAATIAAIIAVVKISIDKYNEDATAAKEAAQAADSLRESSQKLRQEAEELQSTFENYDSLIDALEEAKGSTEEWEEALKKVNDETLNILEKYPDLLKMENVFDETGRLSKDAIDEYIKIAENNADNARLASLSASASASQKKVTSDTTNLSREIDNFVDGYLATTATYAGTGEAATTAQAEKDLINNLIKSFNDQRDSGVITEGADEFNSIINDYTKSLGLSESEQTKLAEKLQSYRGDIVELANATKNATTQMENVAKLSAQQILGQSATEAQTGAWSQAYIDAKKDYNVEGINRWSQANDPQLQKLLTDAGYGDKQLSNNEVYDNNGILTVRFADGFEASIYELAELASTNAAREAANETVVYGESSDSIFSELKAQGVELDKNIDAELATSLLNRLEGVNNKEVVNELNSLLAEKSSLEQSDVIDKFLNEPVADEQINVKEDSEKYDLEAENVENYAESLLDLAEASEEAGNETNGVSADLKDNAKMAGNVAITNSRMNKGLISLAENFDDYRKTLNASEQGTEEYQTALKGISDAMNDVLGLDDVELSDDFLTNATNLDLMAQAANGSAEAVEQLRAAAAQDIIQNIELNDESFREELITATQEFQTLLDQTNLSIGATFDNTEALTGLNELIEKSGMTAEQVQDYFNALGYTPEVDYTEGTQMQHYQGIIPYLDANGEPDYKPYEFEVEESIQIPTIKSLTYNGPAGKTINTNAVKKANSKKGGSSKKDSTKKKSDEIERYHTVNKEIESIESKMSRASSAKDNAFGKNKIPYINKEIDALNELIEKHQEYKAEIEKNLKIDAANIAQYGFIDANADGILDNWEAVMERELEAFNKAAQAYDKGGSETAFEAATKRYEDFKAFVEQYEETQKAMEDALAKEEELERERISKQLEKITAEIEFEIEINQRDLDKLDYVIDKLGRNLNTAIEQIDALGQQIGKYDSQSQSYRQGIADIKANAAAQGRALTDDEQRKIQEYEDALLDINGALLDIVETVEAKILEEFDEFNSKIDDNISRFDTYNSMLDHYNNIIKLSGRQTKDSMLMMELSAQKTDTALQKLNASRDKYLANQSVQSDVKDQLDAAIASGNEKDIKYWQEQYDKITKVVEESHDEMLASWEETLEAAGSQFELAIESTIQTLKNSISEFGLDNLADRYSKGQEEQERYLSNLDREYELNKLNREISGKIDDTDNIKAKQKLLELQDEINKKLASGEEMSRYDLEHLQKKYELELAKIALEEAQNAKSTVRLTKDSEGNFGYVYTADQDSIDNAQQNYEDKLYELKKSSEDYLDEMSEKIIQNQQEMMEALAEVDRTKFETQEEYEAELDRIKEYYMGRDKYYRGEMQKAMDELGITYQETLLGQLEGSASLEEAQSKLEINTNETVSKMGEAWKEWHDTVGNAMEEAGTSSETFTEDIKSDAEEIGTATEDLADVIDEQTENMVDYMGRLVEAVADWRDQYISAIDEIIKKNEELANVQAASFDKDADYSALINEYLNNGGKVGDATYKELRKQRDAKIDWLEEQGYDSSYWGTRGSKTDEMYSRIAGGDGTAEENEWFTKDYIDDEKLAEIFNKLEVPLGALEQTVGNINTGTQEIKTATDTVGGKIDATQNYFNATSNAINTKNAEISGTIGDKLDANSQNALNQISTTEESINQGIQDAEKSLAETLSETVSGGKTLSDIDSSISDAIAAISADIDAAKKEIQEDIGSLSRQVNTLGTAAVGGAMGGPAGALIGGLVGGVISAATTMDTGGYTGSWGPEGKVAVLHEKELVLNKNDTSNLLNTLGVMKDIMHMIDVQANMASLSHLNAVSDIKSLNDTLEQNVTIHAEFPNATNRNEIEEAFSNLVNRATQYANRKK